MAASSLNPKEAIDFLIKKYPQYDFSKAVYTKSAAKITVICPEHGEFYPTYNNMKTKIRGCPKCNGGVKFTEEDALKKLKSLFPNYDYSKFKFKTIQDECILTCDNGHEFSKKYALLSMGHGCNICKVNYTKNNENLRKRKHHTIKDYVDVLVKKYSHIDWTNAYNAKRKKDKCKVVCKTHGEIEIVLENIRETNIGDYSPCTYCNETRTKDPIEILKENNPEYDFSEFNYITSKTKSIVICKEHGKFKASFFNTLNNTEKYKIKCPRCYPLSKIELEIREYIENKFNLITTSDRSIIKSKKDPKRYLEIDIYIPDLKIGFEFHGTHWHKDYVMRNVRSYFEEVYGSSKEYDQYKIDEAKRNGVDLYILKEEDYKENEIQFFLNIDKIINDRLNMK